MTPPRDRPVETLGYAARCVTAAAAALVVARLLGLGHPVWAIVSALVVSQQQIADTRRSLGGRVIGTMIGVLTGLAAGTVVAALPDPQLSGVVMATVVCAIIARRYPAWRACLWTAPIVLLTATAAEPLVRTAFHRAAEVLLGGAIGAATHELATWAGAVIARRRSRR